MTRKDQIDIIRKNMRGQWTTDLADETHKNIITPLITLMAGLAEPDDSSVVYGDIDQVEEHHFRVLLVTKQHFYSADFKTVQRHDQATGEKTEVALLDGYHLRIVPRTDLKQLTIDRISEDRFTHEISRIDYTIGLTDFSISIPVRASYRDSEKEIALLETLHADLA